MGRAEDRKRAKSIKKKLTGEQFNQMFSQANEEFIRDAVKQRFDLIKGIMPDVIFEVLRANKISQERANRINEEIWTETLRRFENGAKKEIPERTGTE